MMLKNPIGQTSLTINLTTGNNSSNHCTNQPRDATGPNPSSRGALGPE